MPGKQTVSTYIEANVPLCQGCAIRLVLPQALGMGEHLGWASTNILELTQRCQKDVFPRWNQCTPSSSVVRAAIPWSLPDAGDASAKATWCIAVGWVAQDCHWTLDIGRTIATGCPSQGSANSLSIFASNALRYWRRLGKGQLSSSI